MHHDGRSASATRALLQQIPLLLAITLVTPPDYLLRCHNATETAGDSTKYTMGMGCSPAQNGMDYHCCAPCFSAIFVECTSSKISFHEDVGRLAKSRVVAVRIKVRVAIAM